MMKEVYYYRGEMMKQSEYINFDGTDLAELVKNKEISKKELAEMSFSLLEKVDNKLNAVTYTRRDKVFLGSGRQFENRPFDGVPIFLKDISQTIQRRTKYRWSIFIEKFFG